MYLYIALLIKVVLCKICLPLNREYGNPCYNAHQAFSRISYNKLHQLTAPYRPAYNVRDAYLDCPRPF